MSAIPPLRFNGTADWAQSSDRHVTNADVLRSSELTSAFDRNSFEIRQLNHDLLFIVSPRGGVKAEIQTAEGSTVKTITKRMWTSVDDFVLKVIEEAGKLGG